MKRGIELTQKIEYTTSWEEPGLWFARTVPDKVDGNYLWTEGETEEDAVNNLVTVLTDGNTDMFSYKMIVSYDGTHWRAE